ncbi:hypothetical protein AJ88_12015 [Mesorhizobium amorphae CCBAU 01583]|nr:hypothetical protein AJ88_12015 [Mesorhizobium amorphae CCBAU 01583]
MKTSNHPDTVLIVDFGSQFTQLIARRIREAGVFSEIVPFQSAEAAFRRINPKAVILSGGPASTSDIGSPRAPQIVFDAGVPVLGICYGQMTLCVQMAVSPKAPTIANSAAPMSRSRRTTRCSRACGRPASATRCG